jgi:AcrR family transcriptional regulator
LSEEAFRKLLTKLQTFTALDTQDPVERLRQGLLAYVAFGLEHPDHYQITFMTPAVRCAEETDRRAAVGCESFECLRNSVRACIDAGALRVIDLETASQVLWAGVHGVTSLLIAKPAFPWVDKTALIEETVNTLLKGLRR